MKARTIRYYGSMFYLSMSIVGVLILYILYQLSNFTFLERTLYNLFIAGGNIFLSVPIIIFYAVFLYYFNVMGIIYHELGHAIAMRHFGYDRLAIWISKFGGMTIGCHGENMVEESLIMNEREDAICDLFGGILSGAMLLIIYAMTQCVGVLIIFSVLINYSAWETLEGEVWGEAITPSENMFSKGFFLMNELTELDQFCIEEELYLDNPT